MSEQRTVRIAKSTLVTKLEANKAAHISTLTEAKKEWEEELKTAVAAYAAEPLNEELFNKVCSVRHQEPESYLKDYDRALLEMSVEIRTEIELTLGEFNQLVNDEWGWSRSFTSNAYATKALRKAR